MTELQWLIKMLTQQKLPSGLKDLFIERIGEVEAQLSTPKPRYIASGSGITIPIQAPSTQRILNEIANEGISTIMPSEDQVFAKPPIAQKRIIGVEVDTGKGTRGPRKF